MSKSKEIVVEAVSQKPGVYKAGKRAGEQFIRYGIKEKDGPWYNTFSDAQGKAALEARDNKAVYRIVYDEREFQGRPQLDITSFEGPVRQAENGNRPEAKNDVDWEAKERRDYKSRAWAIAQSAVVPLPLDATSEQADARAAQVYKLQKLIWNDVCADIMPKTDAEDIPF